MINNKSNIDYDTDIMKNNIVEIMKEKRITQTMLSEETGIAQPTISDVLSKKNSHCFSVPQLVKIASYLGVSTDNLLGVTLPSNASEEITLADVCQKLFEIDKMIKINIGTCGTGEYHGVDSFAEEFVEDTTLGIYFKNSALTNILAEWRDLKSANIQKNDTQKKILQLWEHDTQENSKDRKKRWQFRNKHEQAMYLAKLILKQYYDSQENSLLTFELSVDENVEILKDFYTLIPYYFDDEEDRELLCRYIKSLT